MSKSSNGSARQTTHISRRVVASIFKAFDFAAQIGMPLNRYVVINLRDTPEQGATSAFTRIRHKYRDWLDYRRKRDGEDYVPAYVYAHENPDDSFPHANWALHVPIHLQAEFALKLPRWVAAVVGDVGPFDVYNGPITAERAKRLAKYIAKGVDPEFVRHFHLGEINDEEGPQGICYGKRAGVSPSLGAAARRAAGFTTKRGRGTAHRPRQRQYRHVRSPEAGQTSTSMTPLKANRVPPVRRVKKSKP